MNNNQAENTNRKVRLAERLEVEDDEERQQRLHNVFMQLDKSKNTQTDQVTKSFDFGDRTPFPVAPPSELLSRVQAFLPELAASNAVLARRAQEDPSSVDIEELGETQQYIQMNLGLGVFEQRGHESQTSGNAFRSRNDLDTEMGHEQVSSASSGTSDSSSDSDLEMSNDYDDSDSDTSSVDIISAFSSVIARPIRPLPRRRSTRPEIVTLGDGKFQDSSVKSPESVSSSEESQP
ncbi:hypothetical protein C8Q75DRAFT_765382 [Abortiporus biennis]|nr:hypothetical protein C8Q75DRAFT_765382 [Abortiporus biennis]